MALYSEGQAECESWGGSLASSTTQEENVSYGWIREDYYEIIR